ncbi:MAG TPA: aldehyde dehydrogenase family protein, partial [Pseudonocardia sp.]
MHQQLFIAGRWRDAEHGATFDVEDPATGKSLGQVADASPTDAIAALDAAAAAQEDWAATPPRARSEILRRAFDLVMGRQDELAALMTAEMGKPLTEARGEVAYAAEFLRWFSEEAVRIGGDFLLAPDGRSRFLVTTAPVGPCILVTPWNFPMAMGTRKIGPAIAAGCTMVVKPAEQTPLTMLALTDILQEAGLPDGVLNVVTTSDPGPVIEPLLRDGRARKLSFTGSTEVGRLLLAQAAGQVLRVSLELGGNAPFLVFADADLDAAVDGAMLAKMRNIGEACTAANRFYVHEDVADDFTAALTARMSALKVGPGLTEGAEVG